MNNADPLNVAAGLVAVAALIAVLHYTGRLHAALRARYDLHRRRRNLARWRRTQAAARARGIDV